MNFTIEDISPTRKAVVLTVPAAEIADQEKALVREFAGEVRLPGFRPGKAPADLIKKQYGKAVAEELKNKIIAAGYKHISAEAKLNIYTIVDLKGADDLSAGKDAELRYELDVVPEFELPEYKGLEVAEEPVVVSDEDVENTLKTVRSQRAKFEVVDRAAEKGDYVKLGYEGKIGDEFVKDLAPNAYLFGSQPTTWEEAAGEDAPGVPAIVNGIVGKKAGDKFDATHEFPADYEVETLRGKTAAYAVEVFEVRAKILPEMDEEFFKSVNAKDLDDLKAQIRTGIEKRKENEAKNKKRQALIETLNGKVEFELPESAVDREAYNIFLEFANMQIRQGVDVKTIEAQRDELLKNSKDAAKTRVKTQMLLAKIAEKEGVKVEQNDLNERILQEAYIARTPVDKFAKELSKDRDRLMEMQRAIMFNKALDFVVENSKPKNA